MSTPIRIAIVDDHPLFREGVARSLGEIGGFE
ncbi:MAG: response regulator transcription factor, partial [Mesorhizobium sp.]